MLKATLKGLLAHKLRLVLTALAVVLGVTLMAGTFVLTDTIKHSIDDLFNQGTAGKAVVVRGVATDSGNGDGEGGFSGNARPLVPESLLPAIRKVPGVAVADGQVQGALTLVGTDGKDLSTGARRGGALGFAWEPDRSLSALEVRSGRAPQRDGEVVIDQKTARAHHLTPGSAVTLVANLGPRPFVIVGIIGFGSQDTIAGATLAAVDAATAQAQFGKPGYFTQIDVGAANGVNKDSLVTAVGPVLPPRIEAISAAEAATQMANNLDSFLNTLSLAFLVFGFIALFVGAFIIFNTFSILIGQRTRELALLRAVGASRGQVLTSVLGEAGVTGLLGSIAGLGLGVLLAVGLYKALKSTLSLGAASMQVTPRTVAISLAVGTVITLVSALGPALRASKIPPVAALRDDFVLAESSLRRRATIGGSVLAVGIALLIAGLLGSRDIRLVGLGVALTFVGVAMLVPFVAAPMARTIGTPLPMVQGVKGRLGRENSARNPRRTAATASALMIGIAVVAAVATIASSLLASFDNIFDSTIQANYVVSAAGPPFTAGAAEAAVRSAPGVIASSGFSQLSWHANGAARTVDGIDPLQGPQVFRITVLSGSIAALGQGQVLIDEATRDSQHLKVGDTITMTFAATGDKPLTVGGIYATNHLLDHYVVATDVIAANSNVVRDFFILVKTTPNDQAALDHVLAGFPNLTVKTGTQFKADQEGFVKGLLKIVYALLALSIIVALFGVINTLVLSVFERTREIGLLRSIGMDRRQVRGMIRGEAVIVSVLGAVLGIVLGVAFGATLVPSVVGGATGIVKLVVPWGTIVVVLVAAGCLGVVAAIWPAHRASRLDVLKAIATV